MHAGCDLLFFVSHSLVLFCGWRVTRCTTGVLRLALPSKQGLTLAQAPYMSRFADLAGDGGWSNGVQGFWVGKAAS